MKSHPSSAAKAVICAGGLMVWGGSFDLELEEVDFPESRPREETGGEFTFSLVCSHTLPVKTPLLHALVSRNCEEPPTVRLGIQIVDAFDALEMH